jgi:hypothetical protein
MELGADENFSTPPTRVRLGKGHVRQPKSTQGKWRALEPAPGAKPSIHSYSHWNFLDTGEISLLWSTGFSGLTMVVSIQGEQLIGTAETFWDFPRPKQKAKVQLRKISCNELSSREHR